MSAESSYRNLPVKLTIDEIAAHSLELARINQEEAELEDEKKSVTSSFKDRLDRCKFERTVLARKVTSGEEVRQVSCTVIKDYDNGIAKLTRDDTFQTVETWKLTASDMQESLEL
jgi:hypothetical protein